MLVLVTVLVLVFFLFFLFIVFIVFIVFFLFFVLFLAPPPAALTAAARTQLRWLRLPFRLERFRHDLHGEP